MATYKDAVVGAHSARRRTFHSLGQAGLIAGAILVTVGSAVMVKEMHTRVRPLAAADVVQIRADGAGERSGVLLGVPEETLSEAGEIAYAFEHDAATLELAKDPSIRWFNGRPIRPAGTMMMEVTAYSPDAASCAPFDDGITATLHSVKANDTKMVAADTRLLPFGSLLTIPGYDAGQVVPVLDRGGAIKGNKLDVMFPTHDEAIQWGRQKLEVVVWEYADGLPPDDPRKFR